MKTKKALPLLILLVLLIALASGMMFANDAVEGRSRNVITTGKVEISIKETTTAGNAVTRADGIDFSGILPGQTVEKVVTIRNDAEKCWLRVKVELSVTPQPGDGSDPEKLIVPDIDSAHWRHDSADGYYYYDLPLEKGETAALFDEVSFSSAIGNAYAGATASMKITAEAAQYQNNETPSAASWPA